MSGFELSLDQLREIKELYQARILEGLRADDQEIAGYPTYLGLPDGQQSGRALVVDTGGTNMRAALVELVPSDGRVLSGPIAKRVPDGRDGIALSADLFFSAQAELALGLTPKPEGLPLGYCFSYPTSNDPDGDAILTRWTKGLRIDGVVGTKVGAALQEHLKAIGVETRHLTVLNDTVASLLGGVHLHSEARFGSNYVGLILGTGTNMAGVFPSDVLTKTNCDFPMVVNLESGNFSCPHLTEFDDQLDAESDYPGRQRFEKAVSGHYLPQIFDKACPGYNLYDNTAKLVEIRNSGEGKAGLIASQLLRRSARLAAAGLAAVSSLYSREHDTAVLGEGGLLWGDAQYAPLLQQTLHELVPHRKIVLVHQRENVNLLGAASAAIG
jgi:hexokinase